MKTLSLHKISLLVTAILGLLWVTPSEAQIPRTLSYQGVLCDAAGQPKPDNTYQMTFRLYESVSGGSPICTEVKTLDVHRGLFSTILGPLGSEVGFDKPVWMSIQLDGEEELLPRIAFSPVGYSFNAMKADTAAIALEIPNGSVTAAKVAPSQIVRSINTLRDDVTLQAGSNVTIAKSGNTLTIGASTGSTGTITGVTPVAPLSGGGSSGNVSISLSDLGVTSAKLGDGAVTSQKIVDGTVATADLGNNSVTAEKMSAAGSTSGQVLSSNGSRVLWGSVNNSWLLSGSNIYFTGGNVGIGTSAPVSKLQVASGSVLFSGTTGGTPVSGAGSRFMWIPSKYALRAGYVEGNQWDDGNIGIFSVAMGRNSIASGERSTAVGGGNTASGNYSTAIGNGSTASGTFATAMGSNTRASGSYSTAMGSSTVAGPGDVATAIGNYTTASGAYSIATGSNTVASAQYSTAMGLHADATSYAAMGFGTYVSANGQCATAMGTYVGNAGHQGSFIIGDNSSTTYTTNNKNNEFMAVFAGGYTLYTARNWSQGVYMNGGTSGWTNISDRHKKENFRPIDGETLLSKISLMPITEWNYKGADPSIRYIGPVAQDFYAAFHLGGTDSLGINSICIDGVSMAAIQALEKRTKELKEKTVELQAKGAELDLLRKELAALKDRFALLETALKESKNFAER